MTNKYELDPLLTTQLRFFAMSILAIYEDVDFNFLKKELAVTDGNLGVQLRKLEDAKYLEATKSFVNRKPRTTYKITALGLEKLKNHINNINQFKNILDK